MKTTPQQNKILVPILILAMIGLVAKIVLIVRGPDLPAEAVTTVQEAATEKHSLAHPLANLPETTSRDPFSHPSLTRPGQPSPNGGGNPQLLPGVAPVLTAAHVPGSGPDQTPGRSMTADPWFSDRAPGLSGPAGGKEIQMDRQAEQGKEHHSDQPANAPEAELVAGLKLTAILGGARPAAVIEGYSTQPLIVHQGESFGALRVAAIHTTEIVLSSPRGIWTLLLETNPTEPMAVSGTLKEGNSVAPH